MIPFDLIREPARLADITMQPGEVHLWFANLDVSSEVVRRSAQHLSSEERAKAALFRFAHDHDHFIVAHTMLRLLLAHYCQCAADTIAFQLNAYGKPALKAPDAQPATLHFNLSHTRGLALCGFTTVCELGVDVEFMRVNVDYPEMAKHFFSKREVADLRTLPDEDKSDGFFNAWTRKEAYIKARGKGLSLPLHDFDVSLRPDQPAALLETREEGQDTAAWSMYALPAPESYKAALALCAHNVSLRYWRWKHDFIL